MNPALFRPSSMLRRQKCPGSLALESTLPTVDEPNEYQEQGARLHALVADKSLPRDGCSPSELDLIEATEKAEREFTNTIETAESVFRYDEFTEREFSLHRNGTKILVGHPDSVLVYRDRLVLAIRERKFGYKIVQSADANLQLRAYLVIVASEYPADAYYGCLVQPRVSSRPHIVRYTTAEILQARREIETIFDACYAPNAPRRPSTKACEFCLARTSQSCPEHISWVNAVQTVGRLPVSNWTDEQMEIFESRRSAAVKFIEEVHEQIKQIKFANPDRLPGWKLKPGASVRHVPDLVACWSALQEHMTAREFSDQCEISIGGLEDVIWRKHRDNPALGKLTQKQAKALVNQVLASVLELRQNKPSLVKDE